MLPEGYHAAPSVSFKSKASIVPEFEVDASRDSGRGDMPVCGFSLHGDILSLGLILAGSIGFIELYRYDLEETDMYEPGDYIPWVGEVESNHCGLPWPAYMEDDRGGLIYGTVNVRVLHGDDRGKVVLCDALSGERLEGAARERWDNEDYDYEGRSRDNLGRRHAGEPGVEVMREWSGLRRRFYYFWRGLVG